MSVLDRRDLFAEFLDDVEATGGDRERVDRLVREALAFRRGYGQVSDLERRWYQSLGNGRPDFGVYGDDGYLADLWSCWAVYSRKYLRGIRGEKSLPEAGGVVADLRWKGVGGVERIVDLGCGTGPTSAALVELFPTAAVVGTNLGGTRQTAMAELAAGRYGFSIVEAASETADLVFASEYFEHFPDPVDHLVDVLEVVDPTAILVASTFGSPSIGHFDAYEVDGQLRTGRRAAQLFGRELRAAGYEKVETTLWNARPAYWRKVGPS